MILVTAVKGTFLVEQPAGSYFEFYPRWTSFAQRLRELAGTMDVVSCSNRTCLYLLVRTHSIDWRVLQTELVNILGMAVLSSSLHCPGLLSFRSIVIWVPIINI